MTRNEQDKSRSLEYSGQTAADLLALSGQFRTDSLCTAFETALQKKAGTAADLSDEELVVLAVEAVQREVSSGGYRQFFFNSSHEYTSIAVAALTRIGCAETASITRNAIQALRLKSMTPRGVQKAIARENPLRDEILEACDGMYGKTGEPIADRLFAFIESNPGKISF